MINQIILSFHVRCKVIQRRVKILRKLDFSRQTSRARLLVLARRHCGKLRLRLSILRDGEFLAVRDLFEQVRKRGLGFFKTDCLHILKVLTLILAQSQFFS